MLYSSTDFDKCHHQSTTTISCPEEEGGYHGHSQEARGREQSQALEVRGGTATLSKGA